MLKLIKELFPLQRMINGQGMDDAFNIIKRELPDAIIHEYPSGSEYGDWVIPKAWRIIDGFIDGIASIKDFQYFVVPYSCSVDGTFTRDELQSHVVTDSDRPDVFPFDTSLAYQFEPNDWKISLPYNKWKDMDGSYRVVINTELYDNNMKVAEYFKEGDRKEAKVLSAHIDELCNDDLSGVAVLVELAKWLQTMDTVYSYKILIVPELFGSVAYIHENDISDVIGFIQLETLGHDCGYGVFSEVGDGYGNDERIWGFPTIDVEWTSIQRYPFKEYHSSLDTPDLLIEENLKDALEKLKDVVLRHEKDYIPRWIGSVPWLSKRGLYVNKMRQVPYYINDSNDISRISRRVGLEFGEVHEYIEKLRKEGLIEVRRD